MSIYAGREGMSLKISGSDRMGDLPAKFNALVDLLEKRKVISTRCQNCGAPDSGAHKEDDE